MGKHREEQDAATPRSLRAAGPPAGNRREIAEIATIGLMVLTPVSIGRVAFTMFFFLRQKDYAYVAMAAYVLAPLMVGAALRRIG